MAGCRRLYASPAITLIAQVPGRPHPAGHWLLDVSVRRCPSRALAAAGEWRTTSSSHIPNGFRVSLKQWNRVQMGKTAQFEILDIHNTCTRMGHKEVSRLMPSWISGWDCVAADAPISWVLCDLPVVIPRRAIYSLDPSRRISQSRHTVWRCRTASRRTNSITQTTDGYIWVVTANGLARFDGVNFFPWTPPRDILDFRRR